MLSPLCFCARGSDDTKRGETIVKGHAVCMEAETVDVQLPST